MITSKEREYLRELAKRYSELAHADINEKKRKEKTGMQSMICQVQQNPFSLTITGRWH